MSSVIGYAEKFSVSQTAQKELRVTAKGILTVICGDEKRVAAGYSLTIYLTVPRDTSERVKALGIGAVCRSVIEYEL